MIGTRPLTPNSAGITGPMNLNAVIAHLVELTPGQRKQFAQMHMDDTMLLSTVKYVDDQIGKQAAAKAAQMVGAAPPPVNQQVVAQMAPQPPVRQAAPQPQAGPQDQGQPMPEESGIGQLPAPNMQGIARGAAGGIVAFAEGGLNPKLFADFLKTLGKTPSDFANALPQERATMQQAYEAARSATSAGAQSAPVSAAPAQAAAAAEQPGMGYRLGQMARQGLNRVGNVISEGMPRVGIGALAALTAGNENQNTREDEIMAAIHGESYKGKPYNKKDAEALLKEMNVPGVTLKETAAPPAKAKDDRTKRDPANYAPAEAAPEKKTGVDQLRVAPAPAVQPTIQASSAPAASGLDYNAAFSSALKAEGNPRDNLPPEIAEIGDLARAQQTKAMALADKQSEGLNALVSQRQARQDAREQNIAQQEAINPWMAMITGGLGIAQSKGKGLSGLAEGSQLGINQYMTEAKYTNAQRQKLDDARDALQELKYNGETMTNKDRLAAENAMTQGLMAVKDATVKHIAHKEELNLKTAGHKFDAMVQRDIETQREGHQTQLAGQNQQFQLALNASDNAQRLAIAQMQERNAAARASQLPGEVRAVQLLGGGDYEKGLRKMAEIQSDKTGQAYAKLYVEHVDSARKNNVDPLSPIDFAKQVRGVMAAMAPQGASVVTTKAPVTTGVLQRP
jgi:hypothetical protein